MLKTNSKKAIENIKGYIMNNVSFENYYIETPETFPEIAQLIWNICKDEKRYIKYKNNFEMFCDWLQGLPSCGLGDFYCRYPEDAKSVLIELLEETEAEAEKYTDEEAEKMLSRLIFREIEKNK